MGYNTAYFYANGNTSDCQVITAWLPGVGSAIDGNDSYRDLVSGMYNTHFGRYGEWNGGLTGVESYVYDWVVNLRSFNYISTQVYNSAQGSDIAARNGQRHTWGGLGTCPQPVVLGCTDPSANNYVSNATPGNPNANACTYSGPTISMTGSPLTITSGQTALLQWNISDATSQSLTPPGISVASSSPVTGYPVQPSTTTTYTIDASNANESSSAGVVIQVLQPPNITFTASPNPITAPNGSSLLEWNVGGDVGSVSIDNGIGDTLISSETIVSPNQTTTYTLTALGTGAPTQQGGQVLAIQMRWSSLFVVNGQKDDSGGGTYTGSGAWFNWQADGNNNYALRAAKLGWTSISDSPINENVIMVYPSGSGSGTGFKVSITYSPYQRAPDIGTSDYQTKIIINSIEDIGTNYTVGDVLSTPFWDLADTVNRIVKITNVTPGGGGGSSGSDTKSVTVIVNQMPQMTWNPPSEVNYGDNFDIIFTYRYASQGIAITATYTVKNPNTGAFSTVNQSYSLPGTGSDQVGFDVTDTVTITPPWGNSGPFGMSLTAVASGQGGANTQTQPVSINIDQLPDQIAIQNTVALPSEEPVFAPDEEDAISDPLLVTDIDIPVEIRASSPIKVKFDDAPGDVEANWFDVRPIT